MSSSTHGSHAQTLDSGHASHTTWKSPKPATSPASSAPAVFWPSARASRNVPNAGTHSFSAAISPSDHQNGSTYAGQENGEKTAACMLAMNGRPPSMYGFQSGTSGKRSRV